MKPWIIERIENERRQNEWQPVPLHIQQPPPDWVERHERQNEQHRDRNDRGVCIIGEDAPSERGVTIIEF